MNRYPSSGNRIGFEIRINLAIFDLQVTQILRTKFQLNWPFGSGEVLKSSHLGFPIRKILAISDLQVTLMLSTKFRVNWPFGSGEEESKQISKIAAISAIFDF